MPERTIQDNSALSTYLQNPHAVRVDGSRNIYIADTWDHRIRKISNGVSTTILGNGVPSSAGSLGWLDGPQGLAVTASGDVYVADTYNNRVLLLTASGSVSIVAGTGREGYGGDNGNATSAFLNWPAGLALDNSGSLYIADQNNNRIRKVSPNGAIVTVAGNGVPGFSGDGGPATAANLSSPTGVGVDSAGNLYIADFDNHRVRMVAPTGIISTIAGNGQVAQNPGDRGTGGFGGDRRPAAVALDFSGRFVHCRLVQQRH